MTPSLKSHHTAYNKNWGWFLGWGLALVALGAVAIAGSVMTTIISVVFLGVLLIVGGLIVTLDAYTFWRKTHRKGFFLQALMGLLYVIAGAFMIKSPIAASVSLTLVLGIFYVVIGIFRICSALATRTPRWGWGLFSGMIALLLGVLIMASWPVSGLYIIGLFVGIDLLLVGWFYVAGALTAKAMAR
jgi:uncharacterized membrane protein HdeD (DUF308 family)